MAYRIYVGSYMNEIYTLAFDPDAHSLALLSSLTVGHHPSWVTSHPSDPSIVFTALEQAEGKVVTLKFDAAGKGAIIGNTSSGGADPCTLLVAGDQLLVGNVRRRSLNNCYMYYSELLTNFLFA